MAVSSCPHCRKSITVPDETVGRKAACPHCARGFVIGGTPTNAPATNGSGRRWTWLITGVAIVFGLVVAVVAGNYLLGDRRPKIVPSGPEKKIVIDLSPKEPKVDKKPEPKSEPAKSDPTPAVPLDEQFAQLVARLNVQRRAAKLSPLIVDPELSAACQAHADYIAVNRDEPKLKTAAGLQDEDAALPSFSEDGQKAAKASLLAFAEPRKALDLWLGRLNSRSPLLHPHLVHIGFGAARSARGEWFTLLDAKRGLGAEPIPYPALGQTDIPLSFSGGPETNEAAPGFPVSLQFPLGKTPKAVVAFLTDERGNRIPTILSTPDQPLPGIPRPELAGMIPKKLLAPKSLYRVHFSGKIDDRRFEKEWEFTTEDDGDDDGLWAGKTLVRLNQIRQQAGLGEVELDDDLGQACRAHAKYLVVNARRPEVQGLGVHNEDPKLPGFTQPGKKAAQAANIAIGNYEPIDAIEGWMATLYHRVPILEPSLKKVGFGCARGERLEWVTALDVQSGRDKLPRPAPIFWPVDGQTDVPLNFPPGGETPNPIPNDKTGRAGYPITVTFPEKSALQNADAKLEDAQGRPLACWLSSPASPANPQFQANQGTTVCLIPKEPLEPEQHYRVTVQGKSADAPWKKAWTFTTGKAGMSPGDAVKRTVDRFNLARLSAGLPKVTLDPEVSKGCQAHADYLIRNAKQLGVKGFSANDEDPALPGYSAAGQKSARRSDVLRSPNPVSQIDFLLGTLYRRSLALDPRLRRIGLGCAVEPNQGWINVLDLKSGHADGDPVVFPGIGQENVPLTGRDRIPDDLQKVAGFPITVWFPGRPIIRKVRATLAESTGSAIDIWLSTPEAPFDVSYAQPNIIGIHPRQPLRPGRVYSLTVTADVDGVPWRMNGRFSTNQEKVDP